VIYGNRGLGDGFISFLYEDIMEKWKNNYMFEIFWGGMELVLVWINLILF